MQSQPDNIRNNPPAGMQGHEELLAAPWEEQFYRSRRCPHDRRVLRARLIAKEQNLGNFKENERNASRNNQQNDNQMKKRGNNGPNNAVVGGAVAAFSDSTPNDDNTNSSGVSKPKAKNQTALEQQQFSNKVGMFGNTDPRAYGCVNKEELEYWRKLYRDELQRTVAISSCLFNHKAWKACCSWGSAKCMCLGTIQMLRLIFCCCGCMCLPECCCPKRGGAARNQQRREREAAQRDSNREEVGKMLKKRGAEGAELSGHDSDPLDKNSGVQGVYKSKGNKKNNGNFITNFMTAVKNGLFLGCDNCMYFIEDCWAGFFDLAGTCFRKITCGWCGPNSRIANWSVFKDESSMLLPDSTRMEEEDKDSSELFSDENHYLDMGCCADPNDSKQKGLCQEVWGNGCGDEWEGREACCLMFAYGGVSFWVILMSCLSIAGAIDHIPNIDRELQFHLRHWMPFCYVALISFGFAQWQKQIIDLYFIDFSLSNYVSDKLGGCCSWFSRENESRAIENVGLGPHCLTNDELNEIGLGGDEIDASPNAAHHQKEQELQTLVDGKGKPNYHFSSYTKSVEELKSQLRSRGMCRIIFGYIVFAMTFVALMQAALSDPGYVDLQLPDESPWRKGPGYYEPWKDPEWMPHPKFKKTKKNVENEENDEVENVENNSGSGLRKGSSMLQLSLGLEDANVDENGALKEGNDASAEASASGSVEVDSEGKKTKKKKKKSAKKASVNDVLNNVLDGDKPTKKKKAVKKTKKNSENSEERASAEDNEVDESASAEIGDPNYIDPYGPVPRDDKTKRKWWKKRKAIWDKDRRPFWEKGLTDEERHILNPAKPGAPSHGEPLTWCHRCKRWKPTDILCHHCNECKRCVMGRDHHCPHVGNCVASKNYKFFVLFCFWTFILCFFFFYTTVFENMPISYEIFSRFNDSFYEEEWYEYSKMQFGHLSSRLYMTQKALGMNAGELSEERKHCAELHYSKLLNDFAVKNNVDPRDKNLAKEKSYAGHMDFLKEVSFHDESKNEEKALANMNSNGGNNVFGESGNNGGNTPNNHPLLFYTPDADPPRYNFPFVFRWFLDILLASPYKTHRRRRYVVVEQPLAGPNYQAQQAAAGANAEPAQGAVGNPFGEDGQSLVSPRGDGSNKNALAPAPRPLIIKEMRATRRDAHKRRLSHQCCCPFWPNWCCYWSMCDKRRIVQQFTKKANLINLMLCFQAFLWGFCFIFTGVMLTEQSAVMGTDRLGWKTRRGKNMTLYQLFFDPTPHFIKYMGQVWWQRFLPCFNSEEGADINVYLENN